jgi:hypothetical protein
VTPHRDEPAAADGLLADLADWSPWVPAAEAAAVAPREPGVYLARQADQVIYVGMAGPRDRNGKTTPKGLQGRLRFYASGKALASGLGEAVFTRAISDAAWLRRRLADVEAGRPGSVRDWGRAAFDLAGLELCWTTTPDKASAVALEKQVIGLLRSHGALWNQRD